VKKLFKCHCCEDTFKSQRSRRKHIENDHVDIHSKKEDQIKVRDNDLSSNHDNGNYVNNIKTEANDEFYFNLPLPTDMLQVDVKDLGIGAPPVPRDKKQKEKRSFLVNFVITAQLEKVI